MNIHAKMPSTSEEFLRWNEGREGKREFVHGRVVEMMIQFTRDHYYLASRLWLQLTSQLGLREYIVGSADFGVRTADGVRYPDILVEKSGGAGKELATEIPLLIAEVLSPSTMADDFGPKAQEYLSISSLRHYLILSQDESRMWVWSRDPDHGWAGPEIFEGMESSVLLNGFGISVSLDEVYSGIVAS
jgi:Uma2 family endonuclease